MKDLRDAELTHKEADLFIIIDFLRKYVPKDRQLTQDMICREIERIYGMSIKRRTLSKNLEILRKVGYVFDEKNPYYLVSGEFTDDELRVLIDSLIYTNALSTDSATELVEKLTDLGSNELAKNKKHILAKMKACSDKKGKDVLGTFEEVNRAITNKHKLSINYKFIDKDLRDVLKYRKAVMASPYELILSNNRYVLICAIDGEDKLTNIYLDRLTVATESENEYIRPITSIPGFEKQGALLDYIKASPILSYNRMERFTIRCDNDIIPQFLEDFCGEVKLDKASSENDCFYTVFRVYTTRQYLKLSILPYLDRITVLNKTDFTNDLKETFNKAMHNMRSVNVPRERRYLFADFDEAFKLTIADRRKFFNGHNLTHDQINKLKELDFIETLRVLHTDLTGTDYLEGLDCLENLALIDCKYEPEYLLKYRQIKTLTLTNLDEKTANVLKQLTQLEKLELDSDYRFRGERNPTSLIEDISFMADITNLKSLKIYGFIIKDSSAFSKLRNIKHLSIAESIISEQTLEEIKALLPDCKVNALRNKSID